MVRWLQTRLLDFVNDQSAWERDIAIFWQLSDISTAVQTHCTYSFDSWFPRQIPRLGQNRVYTPYICDLPAKNTVYTPYLYGSGQPYTFLNKHKWCRLSILRHHASSAQWQTDLLTCSASAYDGWQCTDALWVCTCQVWLACTSVANAIYDCMFKGCFAISRVGHNRTYTPDMTI